MLNKHKKRITTFALIVASFIPLLVHASNNKDATIDSINIDTKEIEISWETLYFTYSMTQSYTWDKNTHDYKENTYGNWQDNGKTITIINKSVVPVSVYFEYKKITPEIDMEFSNNHLYLTKNQKESVKMYLKGEPKNKDNKFYKIGGVTAIVT